METTKIIIFSILFAIGSATLFFGIMSRVGKLASHPFLFRPSHYRRTSFIKKWCEQATNILVDSQQQEPDKIASAFNNREIIKGETAEWTTIKAEYKGVPLSIHARKDGDVWLQLPPFLSIHTSRSFKQQQNICIQLKDDIAPIKANVKIENGITNFYLVGEYVNPLEGWVVEDEEIILECADLESAIISKKDYLTCIPENFIYVNQSTDGTVFFVDIDAKYKSAIIRKDSPYNPISEEIIIEGEFNNDVLHQPFTSQDGLIVSASADIVKAWVDLYLFLKKEFS